jgi:hypothetical protein
VSSGVIGATSDVASSSCLEAVISLRFVGLAKAFPALNTRGIRNADSRFMLHEYHHRSDQKSDRLGRLGIF